MKYNKRVDASVKRPGSIIFLLVGLVLFITVAGIFAGFAPAFPCPSCTIVVNVTAPGAPMLGGLLPDQRDPCARCGARKYGIGGRICVVNKLFWAPKEH